MKTRAREILIAFLCPFVFAVSAFGAGESLKPRKPHPKPSRDLMQAQRYDKLASLKFVEGSRVRLRNGMLVLDAGELTGKERARLARSGVDASVLPAQLARVNGTLARYGVVVRRAFSRSEEELRASQVSGELRSNREVADLTLCYTLRFERASADEMIDALVALNQLEIVEFAQPAPQVAPIDATPSYTSLQTYLGASPLGLGVSSLWSESGGRGQNMRFADVEAGWMSNHEDLPAMAGISGTNNNDPLLRFHSTGVRGILNASDNGFGVTGIASAAAVYGSSVGDYDAGEYHPADAVDAAANQVNAGDVILIEVAKLNCVVTPPRECPLEYDGLVFAAIDNATANGRVVVEGGGNTPTNLDEITIDGVHIFDRNYRDSEAIIVGAGTSTSSHNKLSYSVYGSRVDVQGWGENIWTTGCLEPYYPCAFNPASDNSRSYMSGFGGTSGATAMIAGSAGVINGIRKARSLALFTSAQMRDALLAGAVAQGDPQNGNIGPFPNAVAVVAGMSLDSPVTTATGSASSVAITWPSVSGATDYRVYRASSGSFPLSWSLVGTTTGTTLTDTSVSGGVTYMYSVRSRDASGYESLPPGKPDLATTIAFTDEELQGQPIRAKYMVEVRTAANSLCTFAGTAKCATAPYNSSAVSEAYVQTQALLAAYFKDVWNFAGTIRTAVGAKAESRIAAEPAIGNAIEDQHMEDLRRIVN